ncbi:MAG: FUSC family protein, partial [Candidatus Dormibacteraeota bacterium]|nr:FUSC family protein [Candidatus Dormibacteraeota bacterium]
MARRLLRRLARAVRPLWWRVAEPPEFLPPLAVQCIKVALGCGIVWFVGPYVDLPRPYNAVLAVIILMQGNAYGSLLNALQFLIGVAAGVLLGVVAIHYVQINAPAMALIMFVCLLAGGWLRISSQGFNNQIAVSALLVLASGASSNINRLGETVLGGAVGVAVAALIWPPNPIRGLRRRARELSAQLSEDIAATVELVADPASDRARAEETRRRIRDHNEAADAAVAQVAPAQEALRWNPWHFRRNPDLSRIEDRLRLISLLYRSVRALARHAEAVIQAETPAAEAGGALRAAGQVAGDAVQTRLRGQDAADLVEQGRQAVSEFVARAPRDQHALALAASLDTLLSDVEGWSWNPGAGAPGAGGLIPRILKRL